MADMGIDAGKLKVGLDLDSDERRLGIVKDALSKASDRPLLCIDSNEYWSPKQAIRFISKLEEKFDITCAEEPARRWDYNGLKKVSDNLKAAVATGENINDLAEFMPLIDNGAVDIVEVGSYNCSCYYCYSCSNYRSLAYRRNLCTRCRYRIYRRR